MAESTKNETLTLQNGERIEPMIHALAKTFMVAHADDDDQRLAATLVFNAGRLAWRLRESGVKTEHKTSLSDVVTVADKAAELFVTEILTALRADDGILGEEGAARDSRSGRTWVIDPVDGTYNFVRGSDYWCSALALVEGDPNADDNTVLLGAVHRPAMGYTWLGGKDVPTTLDEKPLPTFDERETDPSKLCLATYLHPTDFAERQYRHTWLAAVEDFTSLRMLGSGSIDMAGVAAGEFGAWIQHSTPAWDWLPGRGLIEGLGGRCIRIPVGETTWSLAGHPKVVEATAAKLRALE